MIVIGLGANLKFSKFSSPRATCGAAMKEMENRDLKIKAYSSWYESPPWPPSNQPWYTNSVCEVITDISPGELLCKILSIEEQFGRKRLKKNGPRTLDLDIVSYNGLVDMSGLDPILPHPRLSERAFVLYPLRDIDPNWRHPMTEQTINELVSALPSSTEIRKIEDGEGAYGTEWIEPL